MQPLLYQVRTTDGRIWGPLTDEQVRASIHAGGVTPNSLITLAGAETWAPVWQHPVFGPYVRSLPPPPMAAAPAGAARRKEMSSGKIIAIVLAGVVLLFGLIAIPVVYVMNSGKSALRALMQESEKPQTLLSTDPAQLTFPAGWRSDPTLNDEASLQASGHFRTAFVVVISEPKGDFPAGTDAQAYSDLTRPALVESLTNASASPPRRLTVNGSPVVQYEINGSSEGDPVTMLHNSIQAKKGFYQVLLWTTRDKFAERKPELDQILRSFREL